MKKFEIRQALLHLNGAKEKEQFLKDHNIRFTHNSFNVLIIWCEDGVLELKPIYRGLEK